MAKLRINYVTSSPYKMEENKVFVANATLLDGAAVKDLFEFEFRQLQIAEMLVVDLLAMVQSEVTNAYGQIKVPCIVEHAGLIFEDYDSEGYPGGLTKPMWNTLGDRFIQETQSAGRNAKARAVVAYCDGMGVKTFVGEREGVVANAPRGSRQFYWDTVFVPHDPSGRAMDKTYAEIVDDPGLGLPYKVELSQSTAAMKLFLEHLRRVGRPELWK